MDLIDIYYKTSELFDDDTEVLINAIKDLTNTQHNKSAIRAKLNGLNLKTLESELNQLLDMTITNLREYKLKHTHFHQQTTIFDFLKDGN